MKINMKNLNVFRRLDELGTANMHLQVRLKNLRMELDRLKAARAPVVTSKPKPKPKVVKASEKRREYARKYYAKKRAEKLAAMEAA
jgi:hypothetical protein